MASGLVCLATSDRQGGPVYTGARSTIGGPRPLLHSQTASMNTRLPGTDAQRGNSQDYLQLPSLSSIFHDAHREGFPRLQSEPSPGSRSAASPSQRSEIASPERDPFLIQIQQRHPLHARYDEFAINNSNRNENGDVSQFTAVNEIKSIREDLLAGAADNPFQPPAHLLPSAQFRHPGPPTSPEAGHTRVLVREETVPGKGLCYIYSDGTVCPKIINGDTVNPRWGTTKAGKPRKRLGQACNTCREKKIKCDPSVPKCAQCQKFNRQCKFETTVRTTHRSPGGSSSRDSPSGSETARDTKGERAGSTTSLELKQDRSNSTGERRSSMTVGSMLSPTSTEDAEVSSYIDSQGPSKRARFSASPRNGGQPQYLKPESPQPPLSSRPSGQFSIQEDPYEVDQSLVLHYFDNYFSHINTPAYCMLPQPQFMHWIRHAKNKSHSDKMLLYAMLALGALFGKTQGSTKHRHQFSEIAEEALARSSGTFELQIVQTRLVLSLFYYALNHSGKTWEFCGSAVRTAYRMGLNLEEEQVSLRVRDSPCYGLDSATLTECRRRTFWAAYVMDCLNTCCSASNSSPNKLNCMLRLPCADAMYEEGIIPKTSFFCEGEFSGNVPTTNDTANLSQMAFLVQISSILNKIITQINHSRFKSSSDYNNSYEVFHQEIVGRLRTWDVALTEYFRLEPTDHNPELRPRTHSAPEHSETGLHVLYHYGGMILHRYVRYEHMPPHSIVRNCKTAYSHARKILELMQKLNNRDANDIPEARFAETSPITGHAILLAIDSITAAGTMSNVLESGSETMMGLVYGGIEALERLMEHWDTARLQLDLVRRRVGTLLTASKSGESSTKAAFFVREPLHSVCGWDQDIIYGLPRLQYLQALGGARVKSEADMHEIGGQANE